MKNPKSYNLGVIYISIYVVINMFMLIVFVKLETFVCSCRMRLLEICLLFFFYLESCGLTLIEGQQQQRRETRGDGWEEQNAAPAKAASRQINEDAGRGGGAHSRVVVQVKVGGVTVEVCGETVLDGGCREAAGKREGAKRGGTADRFLTAPGWKL